MGESEAVTSSVGINCQKQNTTSDVGIVAIRNRCVGDDGSIAAVGTRDEWIERRKWSRKDSARHRLQRQRRGEQIREVKVAPGNLDDGGRAILDPQD